MGSLFPFVLVERLATDMVSSVKINALVPEQHGGGVNKQGVNEEPKQNRILLSHF